MPSWCHMQNCVKQILLSFVNGNFILLIFFRIIKNAVLLAHAKPCETNSCSVLLMVISYFLFVAVSKMPSWCHIQTCVKQFLLSFVKYHTYFGHNRRKKLREKTQRKIKKSSNIQTSVKIF